MGRLVIVNIWILTIGSSDVQLKSKTNWTTLFRNVRSQLDDRGFNPSEGKEGHFQVPARVMGVVYSQPQTEEYFDDLVFPLITNFISKIKEKSIKIDQIILVLSDQSVFSKTERSSQYHPYWQDTCTLQTLLDKYLERNLKDIFPDLHFESTPLILKAPSTTEGLEDWNSVLKLVQNEFSSLDFPDDSTIYVSHQAGTPAMSSAVQFCSLAKFGDQVKFLVSNEQRKKLTDIVESSTYLKGIKREQTKQLWKHYDYAGISNLVTQDLGGNEKILLEAAIQWNFAEFDNFANRIEELSGQQFEDLVQAVKERRYHWWWFSYEAAYLALIRLDPQKNAVESFFHSFRAVEGLISRWAEVTYPDHVDPNNDSPQVKVSILSELPEYLINKKQEDLLKQFHESGKLGLHSFQLYDLLRKGKPEWRSKCKSLPTFTEQIAPIRNKLFHRLKGLEVADVFQEWKVKDMDELETRIRHYLNFVSDQSFDSLKEASLMVKVHQELEKAIANL